MASILQEDPRLRFPLLFLATREGTVLDHLAIRVISRIIPGLVPGSTLHRRALAASANGRYVDAERWFESAASAYRVELAVEGLARLRGHQAMSRARGSGDPTREAGMMLEIVRGLNHLDQLESCRAPFPLMDARAALSDWLSTPDPDVSASWTAPQVQKAA